MTTVTTRGIALGKALGYSPVPRSGVILALVGPAIAGPLEKDVQNAMTGKRRRLRAVRTVRDIDWERWLAHDPATLVFIIRNGHVLLIRKKRGLGAGKVNAPGGRLEPGESVLQAAIREVQEEVGLTPVGLRWSGENRFQFVDGYSIHVHVFTALDCVGEPRETDEATPFWVKVESIPFEEMWEDDRLWFPLLLSRTRFSGRYIFDGDRMLDYELQLLA